MLAWIHCFSSHWLESTFQLLSTLILFIINSCIFQSASRLTLTFLSPIQLQSVSLQFMLLWCQLVFIPICYIGLALHFSDHVGFCPLFSVFVTSFHFGIGIYFQNAKDLRCVICCYRSTAQRTCIRPSASRIRFSLSRRKFLYGGRSRGKDWLRRVSPMMSVVSVARFALYFAMNAQFARSIMHISVGHRVGIRMPSYFLLVQWGQDGWLRLHFPVALIWEYLDLAQD